MSSQLVVKLSTYPSAHKQLRRHLPNPFHEFPWTGQGKKQTRSEMRGKCLTWKKSHPVIYFPVWLFSVLHLCVSGEGWGEEPLVGQGFEPQHVFAGQRGAPQPHRVHYWLNLQKEILNKFHEARGKWWWWAFAPVTGGWHNKVPLLSPLLQAH